MFDKIKNYFPVFEKNKNLVFLDTAASALKPKKVIETISNSYAYEYANVHRGLYKLSSDITKKYEDVRIKTSNYINSKSDENIIFTKSATEAINLVVSCFSEKFLNKNDEVIISYLEHHANIVPWHIAAKKIGFKVIAAEITKEGTIDLDDLKNKINSKTKFISLTHMSNVTGAITDFNRVKELIFNKNIPLMIDGCQMIAHSSVNVEELNCDFYVYSGHKLYGPTGVGVLYMKDKWFDLFDPYQGGGSMIDRVNIDNTTFARGFQKFEAGTPPIVQVIGLGASYDFISNFDLRKVLKYEKDLYDYAFEKIRSFNDIKIIGHSEDKGGILTFVFEKIHSNDVSMILDQHNIAIRSGHHCAQPLLERFNINSTARASFGIYNDKKDVDSFIEALKDTKKFFR